MFMLYDEKLRKAMLDILEDRVSSIARCVVALTEEGYEPNKNKSIILDWSSILIAAYENIDVLDKEQQQKIDIIYNKVLKL